jgi:hypothetical protein
MKAVIQQIASVFAIILVTSSASASLIVTGELTYDTTADTITGGGNTYLAWDIGASWDYATTLANTSPGGSYENYRIATQTEAYVFFNLANTGDDVVDTPGPTFTPIDALNDQDRFGENYAPSSSSAWFLSDEIGADAGALFSQTDRIILSDMFSFFDYTDSFAAGGDESGSPVTWLLVQNESVVTVSEPASIVLFGLGLLGLAIVRRRSR